MKIIVDKYSSVSVHDQIYNEIENRIMTGVIRAESRLPSLRKMCEDIGVSHMTMVRVYQDLEANGLVEKLHGKGTYVKSQLRNLSPFDAEQVTDINTLVTKSQTSESSNWQDNIQDYVSAAGFRFNNSLKHSNDGVNLSIACLGSHLVPTRQVLESFQSNPEMNKHMNDMYPPIEGLYLMREAAVDILSQRQVDASAEDLMITVGSQQAIRLAATTFIGPGDVVVVGSPTYPGALDIFKNRGALIMEVPIDRQGMDTSALLCICETHRVKLVYTMPSYQNPTGSVMTLERKQELLELAEYHNFIIFEDDVCGQLSYEGSTLPLKAMDKSGRVIYALGFSKIYGHAFRLSALVAAEKLLSKMISAKSSSDGGAPLINQLIMASFIGSDEQKHYLTDLTSHLRGVRDRLYMVLKKHLPPYVEVEKPRGGMLFWLTFPKYFNCNLLHYKCLETFKINFLPGEFCYNSKQGRNQMRICFTSAPEDTVVDALVKICSLIEDVNRTSQMY